MKNKNKQTKFPVARIKKIMQKDEEVGKVAQATPIVISKALELFLALIIEESNKVTASRGSRKVEAYHLKHAVETTEMLDFLKEIVEGVPDPSAGGTIDVGDAEGKKKRGKARKAEGPELLAPRKKRKKPEEDVVMAEQSEPEQDEDNKQEAAVSRSRSAEDDDEDSYD